MAAFQRAPGPGQRSLGPAQAFSDSAVGGSGGGHTARPSRPTWSASLSPFSSSTPGWRTLAYAGVVITLGTLNQITGKIRSKPLGRFDYFVSLCNAFLYFFVYSVALVVSYRWKVIPRANLAFVWPSLFDSPVPSSRVSPYQQTTPSVVSSSSSSSSFSPGRPELNRQEEGSVPSSSPPVAWPTCLSSPLLAPTQTPRTPRNIGAWRYFVLTGFCDASGNILGFIAQPFVPGPLFSLATQAIVPFSCLCSMLLLKRRYSLGQIGALLLVTAGFFVAWYPVFVPDLHTTGRWFFFNGTSRLEGEHLWRGTKGASLDADAFLRLARTQPRNDGGIQERYTKGWEEEQGFRGTEDAERLPDGRVRPRQDSKQDPGGGIVRSEDSCVLQLQKQGRACSPSTIMSTRAFELLYEPSVQLPWPNSQCCSTAGVHRTPSVLPPSPSFIHLSASARRLSSVAAPASLSSGTEASVSLPVGQLTRDPAHTRSSSAVGGTQSWNGGASHRRDTREPQQEAQQEAEQPTERTIVGVGRKPDRTIVQKEKSWDIEFHSEKRPEAERGATQKQDYYGGAIYPRVIRKKIRKDGSVVKHAEQQQKRQGGQPGAVDTTQSQHVSRPSAKPRLPPFPAAAPRASSAMKEVLELERSNNNSFLLGALDGARAPDTETGNNAVDNIRRRGGAEVIGDDADCERRRTGQSVTRIGLAEPVEKVQKMLGSQRTRSAEQGAHLYVLNHLQGQSEEAIVRKSTQFWKAPVGSREGKLAVGVGSSMVERRFEPRPAHPQTVAVPFLRQERWLWTETGEGSTKKPMESRMAEGRTPDVSKEKHTSAIPTGGAPRPTEPMCDEVSRASAPRSECESEGVAVWLYMLLVALSTLPTALSFAIKEKLLRDFEKRHGCFSGAADGTPEDLLFVQSEDGNTQVVHAVGSATLVYTEEAEREDQLGGEDMEQEEDGGTFDEEFAGQDVRREFERTEHFGAAELPSVKKRNDRDDGSRCPAVRACRFPGRGEGEDIASVRQNYEMGSRAKNRGEPRLAPGRPGSSGALEILAEEAGLTDPGGGAQGFPSDSGELNRERLHVLVLCAHGSAFQLLWVLASIPLSLFVGQIGDESVGSYLSSGLRCFLGWTDDFPPPLCRHAPEAYGVYALVNLTFNLSLIGFVSIASSLLTFICMKATLPLSILLYAALPWPLLDPHDVQVTADTVIGLFIVLLGVVWFHAETERNRTVFFPSGNPTCCWPLSLSSLRSWLARVASSRRVSPQ
ncbi:transmembrane protein [Cystoisospora suis]|uniref:Transmembrane protein n=1 Tax=Cystoisospora suis TaxID=483139 RepID=A0A2C6KRR0_9APIC|nr:transmembrane protein [Cystoisospora suis]